MKLNKTILFIPFFLWALSLTPQNDKPKNDKPQNGLENIIVEKYYISDANDTVAPHISGFLPIGSTTYRIFVDMRPGYRFQAAYGNANHELKIETTTKFFNNEHIGNKNPDVIPRRTLKQNTVMLDSWLSVGSAGEDYFGVLKEQDDSIGTIVHEKSFLQSKNKLAGIPLKNRDGLREVEGATVPFPSFYGVDSAALVFFNATTGHLFSTTNGAWGCLKGAVGPDSLTTNHILIAQLTTNGDLSFELNIQIGKGDGTSENYVAKNPVDKEIMLPCLTYHSRETKIRAEKTGKPVNKNK